MDVSAKVRSAMREGASTRKDIAMRTGLSRDLVDAVLDVMVRTGDVDVHALKFECGASGCGSCSQDSTCSPAPLSGPVPVPLHGRR